MRNITALLQSFKIPYYDKGSEWLVVECAYHNDKHNVIDHNVTKCHGGIHRTTGAYKCMSCGATGTYLKYLAVKFQLPEAMIEAKFDNITGEETPGYVKIETIQYSHQSLLDNKDMRDRMLKQHGITEESIVKFRLGWHPSEDRIIIPIMGPLGEYVNLRKYKYDSKKDKVIGIKGGKAVLWPIDNITQEDVIITEGEFKAVILMQHGFNAITGTAGAGTWNRKDWNDLFKNKNVVIIYDVDEAGRRNANTICVYLYPLAKTVKNVFLKDVQSIPKGDITNYFVDKQRTREDLIALINATPYYTPPRALAAHAKLEMNDPIDTSLAKSSTAELMNKIVATSAVVSAKDTIPYIIPKKATVLCNRDKPYCPSCQVYDRETPLEFEIKPHSPAILDLINATATMQDEVLKEHSGIYLGCKVATFRRDESYNVEEIRLIPQIAVGHTTDEQVTRKAYHVGHGIAPNHTYEFEGRVCAEPKDGHATLVLHKSKLLQTELEGFVPTVDLSIFKPKEWTAASIEEKLNHIYEDLESNVTKIYQRRDLHLFYDLIWHTVLWIPFPGQPASIKGWGDGLCIGDSGQGKSECSSRMSIHYACGERVDTKRASVAGIVGGLQETGKRWFITWGTIPLNDRRLVILEEIKGMGAEELSKMTDMRSRGVAEITKIERARTNARTRLIWISNPRSDSKLEAYNYGVDAVKELIGGLEDIRRFDMVIAVASGDVPQSVINSKHDSTVAHTYTTELCQQLISWAWSRTEAQIRIECEQEIYDAATRMGEMYSSACPIVEPSDQRWKLLRLATGLAARTFSTDDGVTLVVRPCHVKAVEDYLNRIYSQRSLGYKDFSASQLGESILMNTEAVKTIMKDQAHAADLVKGLIEAEQIRIEDIINLTENTVEAANTLLGHLTRAGCLKRTRRGGYRKTAGFIELLKLMDRAENLSNMTIKEKLQKSDF